jgi:hypothetical protein
MIVAFDKSGHKVRASETLPHVSDGGVYKCTYKWCPHPEMILRKGKHVIPHFAHKEGGGCDALSEADAERHLQIKDFFQEFLGLDVDDMDYGDIEGVRPDILYQKKYAIELQCSPISDDEIRRRNAIYIKHDLIPVWIFDEVVFLPEPNRYSDYKLRVSERYVHTIQKYLIYFSIDTTVLTPSGFPTIALQRYQFANPSEGSTKFRSVSHNPLANKSEIELVFADIANQWQTFQSQVLSQSTYRDVDLYEQDDHSNWKIWRKSVVCNEVREVFGACNKRFYVEPDSDQLKCDSCIEAQILKLWKDVQPGMTIKSVAVNRRKLRIEGNITLKEFFKMDHRNAGNIFYHLATIDQLKIVFNLTEEQYHDLRTNYENQLNRVYSNITPVSDTSIDFSINTLLRERKTKAHTTLASTTP